MTGATPQFLLCACMGCMGTTLPSPVPPSIVCRVSLQQRPNIMIDSVLRHQQKT